MIFKNDYVISWKKMNKKRPYLWTCLTQVHAKSRQLLVLQERSKGTMFKKVSWLSFSECLY